MRKIMIIIMSIVAFCANSLAQSDDVVVIIPRDDSLAVAKETPREAEDMLQYNASDEQTSDIPIPLKEDAIKVLRLPALTEQGKMPSFNHYYGIGSWFHPYFGGMHSWNLHEGLNASLDFSVFSTFGSGGTWSGAGFGQNIALMYAKPLTDKLSLAVGGYFSNSSWAHQTLQDAGLSAVLGYQFDEHWSGYVYAQKSLVQTQSIPYPLYDINDMGDRIGAAVRYAFSPSFAVQINIEKRFEDTPKFLPTPQPKDIIRR